MVGRFRLNTHLNPLKYASLHITSNKSTPR